MEANDLLWLIPAVLGALGLLALGLGVFILRRVRRVELPADAGFWDALREAPLVVVIFLDVLDLALDGFGAPVAWWVLGKVGLGKLRGVAVVEALVPGTQVVPTMTVAWVIRRLAGPRRAKVQPATIEAVRALPLFAALVGLTLLTACEGRLGDIEPILDEDPVVPDEPVDPGACLDGDLTITAAADAEALDGVGCLDGDLILDGVEASTLALGDLQIVHGRVVVGNNPGLESLALPRLRTVDGEVRLIDDGANGNPNLHTLHLPLLERASAVRVVANPALSTLSLDELAVIDGTLAVVETLQLDELVLPRLTEVGGDLNFPLNGALYLGLPELEAVAGDLIISPLDLGESDTLEEIDAPNLREIGGDLYLSGNTFLDTLSLPSLETVEGRISLNGNHSLPIVDLPSLATLGGDLSVRFDATVTDIRLPALSAIGGDLTIRSNDQLPGCRAREIGDQLTVAGETNIGDNRAGCDCAVSPVVCQ